MRTTERTIVLGALVAALAFGFYLLVLGPKRDKASELSNQIDQARAQITQQQQVADFAEQARQQFPRYYGRLVVLGKAVPGQADTASMLVQLSSIAHRSKVAFRAITLNQGTESAGAGTSTSTPPAATPPSSSSTASGQPASTGTSATATSTTGGASPTTTTASTTAAAAAPAPATEASAATLPIGAVVGTGGLATLPYKLNFTGSFFNIANFIGGLDDLVTPSDGGSQLSSNGRLFTVNGFALTGGAPGSSPRLQADFAVTTYVTPQDQGLTAGATPSGPAPGDSNAPQAQPASAVVK